jgi:hypothetical protein
MRNAILMSLPAALLVIALPQAASAAPVIGAGALTAAAETLSPVENVHYYGYGRGYYGGHGRGYYGGYGGYGRGYYGGYGRGYHGGYGRGYYGGRGYYYR